MYAYTENNPIKYVDPTKENDGVEPLRPVWSSPYDYYYNDWYVHPKYTNMNLYSEIIYENLNYSEYNGPSYFWYYTSGTIIGIGITVVGYFSGGVGWVIGGVVIAGAGEALLVHEVYLSDYPDVYTITIRYNERHDRTRAYFRFYETYTDDDYMGIQYRQVGYAEYFFDGRTDVRSVNEIIDKYN